MTVENRIRELAEHYAKELARKVDDRVKEMEQDDKSHYLIYRVLGVSEEEGHQIDVYQSKGGNAVLRGKIS